MNQLQKEILQAIESHDRNKENFLTYRECSEAAAEVCLRWVDTAYKKGCAQTYFIEKSYKKWLKDNGLTE